MSCSANIIILQKCIFPTIVKQMKLIIEGIFSSTFSVITFVPLYETGYIAIFENKAILKYSINFVVCFKFSTMRISSVLSVTKLTKFVCFELKRHSKPEKSQLLNSLQQMSHCR